MTTRTRVGWRAALAGLLLTALVGCASPHQSVVFTALGDVAYGARPGPAQISDQSPEELAAAGYEAIGTLIVIRVISVCYETCKRVEHQQTCTQTLLARAGEHGGDLVTLDQDNIETTREIQEQGKCLESYIEDRTVEQYVYPAQTSEGMAGRTETVERPVEVCTKFEVRHGHETFAQSSGVVWRRASDE